MSDAKKTRYNERIVIPGVQSPCGTHCEQRTEGCKKTCRRWKGFEILKQMVYAKKRKAFEACYKIQAPQKRAERLIGSIGSKQPTHTTLEAGRPTKPEDCACAPQGSNQHPALCRVLADNIPGSQDPQGGSCSCNFLSIIIDTLHRRCMVQKDWG